MSGKPTLNAIRKIYNIELDQLANATGLEKRIVYLAGIGGQISEQDAEKILQGLFHLTGKQFTKSEIKLNIKNLVVTLDRSGTMKVRRADTDDKTTPTRMS